MAAWLLCFATGMAIFIGSLQGRKRRSKRKSLIPVFMGIGLAMGVFATLVPVRIFTPFLRLPLFYLPAVGGLAGLLIGFAERGNWFGHPLRVFFAMPVLGFALALCSGILLFGNLAVRTGLAEARNLLFPVVLVSLLTGFMTVFGYAFPRLWFRRYLE
jgi:hypothetical protein